MDSVLRSQPKFLRATNQIGDRKRGRGANLASAGRPVIALLDRPWIPRRLYRDLVPVGVGSRSEESKPKRTREDLEDGSSEAHLGFRDQFSDDVGSRLAFAHGSYRLASVECARLGYTAVRNIRPIGCPHLLGTKARARSQSDFQDAMGGVGPTVSEGGGENGVVCSCADEGINVVRVGRGLVGGHE